VAGVSATGDGRRHLGDANARDHDAVGSEPAPLSAGRRGARPAKRCSPKAAHATVEAKSVLLRPLVAAPAARLVSAVALAGFLLPESRPNPVTLPPPSTSVTAEPVPGQTMYLKGGIHRSPGPLAATAAGTEPVTLTGHPGDPGCRPFGRRRGLSDAEWGAGQRLRRHGVPGVAVSCESCSDSVFDNLDAAGDADGLAFAGSGGGDVVRGCRSFGNGEAGV
jgi:hypothetical protein